MRGKLRLKLRHWLFPEFDLFEWESVYLLAEALRVKSKRRKIKAEDIVFVGDIKNCEVTITPKYELFAEVKSDSMLTLSGTHVMVNENVFTQEVADEDKLNK